MLWCGFLVWFGFFILCLSGCKEQTGGLELRRGRSERRFIIRAVLDVPAGGPLLRCQGPAVTEVVPYESE